MREGEGRVTGTKGKRGKLKEEQYKKSVPYISRLVFSCVCVGEVVTL